MLLLYLTTTPCKQAQAQQTQTVSLELVLAVDVSASVDDTEFRLQMNGIARAFRRPEIVAAIKQHPQGVAVALVQWGGWAELASELDWRLLSHEPSIFKFAADVEAVSRRHVGHLTAIGHAIEYATTQLEHNAYVGRRRKIDISGDGQSNAGAGVVGARIAALRKGITINGLAILTNEPKLFDYYRDNVISGPAAFVLRAESYDDFSDAMSAKLIRELTLQVASSMD